ncbi:hypothetical protein GCM10027169_00230 [Gordonia jinhuaensis]|uniref:Uncharacterized protein n=1 Tax=Gordonia jinhuaensis TaxID=1517702 RepID=A0A916SVR4_9ACTN|nr:hypothetical protein [Gordonia jinhuaensis]GGB18232.1 hypothetical protein GCM10011489_02890 [Gordonia jinhuaensis]
MKWPARDESRWEAERADFLRDGAAPESSALMRADKLTRAAVRAGRAEAGLSGATSHAGVGRSWWYRQTHGSGGERRRIGKLGVLAVLAAVWVGPGVLLGHGVYRALQWASPRIGRLWAWPWLVAAGALLVGRWIASAYLHLGWPKLGVGLGTGRYFPADFIGFGGLLGYLQWSLVVACATAAWAIRAWGWAAVPRRAVAPSAKNRDGSWREIPDSERIGFEVYGADELLPEPEPIAVDDADEQTYWGKEDEER